MSTTVYDFLRKIPFFAELPEEDLERLCEMVDEVSLPAGAELFLEGSMGDRAYVIKDGQIEIIKFSGGREVLLAIRHAGEVIGEMSLIDAAPRIASARAKTDSKLLAITQEQFDHLINTSPSAARATLHTFTSRLRSTQVIVRQSEKMAQLGTLTAGMAHELNNPAAAAKRGAEQLHTAISQLQEIQVDLYGLGMDAGQRDILKELDRRASKAASMPSDLDSLERSDHESELEDWLDEHGIERAWELAPNLVNLGYEPGDLDALAWKFSDEQFPQVLTWLCISYTIYSLLEEIDQGAGRISEIVKALKLYIYLDQAPVQLVDVREGLDSTLLLLRSKLKDGVTVRREYDPDLPRIQVYGSELNQVWTNIIDNAVDAMGGKGEIVLRTRGQGDWVTIEIEDNGPGIPEEIQPKIFDPFFTTKPPGKGTGLGLNITYNIVQKHGGDIQVFSQPGKTIFEVQLPVNFEAVKSGSIPVQTIPQTDDETIKEILETTKNIAVVGISARNERPAYTVPRYLQSHGYSIIPVNPNLESVLDEKAYPDLTSVPTPVDTVLIFRRSEVVPPIVDEAIRIGAKTVWMQEGIVNEQAATAAARAGLKVVMDTCMRAQHKRLIAVDGK